MIKRTLVFAAALAAALASSIAPAASKEKITYAYLLDPSIEGVLYAIRKGIVKSDLIEIEATSLAIPALIQATPTKEFDVLMNAVMAIPSAKQRGLDLVVLSTALRAGETREDLGLWVKADSPYETVADLKGKTIGNFALQSTGTTWVRIALKKKHGINVSYENGDFNWVEMPAPALLGALQSDRIDAATLISAQAYKADKSGGFRCVAYLSRDIHELLGVDPVVAVNVSYPDKLAARPEAFEEFNRMLKESVEYAVANSDEVGRAISKETKISPDYFKAWISRYYSFPASVSDADLTSMETVWQNAKELGIIEAYPTPASVIWERAIRE